MAIHSSVLAWRSPGTGEPGGLPLWGRTELDTTEATQQQQQQQQQQHLFMVKALRISSVSKICSCFLHHGVTAIPGEDLR